MKRNDLLIALAAISFPVLFYDQDTGINFILYSLVLGGMNILINKETLPKRWYVYLGINLLMAWNVFFIHSGLSVFAWVISYIWMIGSSVHSSNSAILSFFSSFLSPVNAFIVLIQKLRNRSESEGRPKKLVYLASICVALVMMLVFFALYKGANPLFDRYTDKIDLSWINGVVVYMIFLGFVFVTSLLYPFRKENIAAWDSKQLENMVTREQQNSGPAVFAKMSGNLVFGGLNLMLLLLNVLDVNYIFIEQKLPKGINLSDFVHTSVTAIVFSILLAVSIILLTRRAASENKVYRFLVYGWIIQSLIMLFHTFVRNSWYISEYQMTYLRIGVYVFLCLSVLGLIFTTYILREKRSTLFLFDMNIKSWLLVLFLSAFLNWDGMISNYNLAKSSPDKVDLNYLFSLSENNTPVLYEYYLKHTENLDSVQVDLLMERKRQLYKRVKHTDWQSYSLGRHLQYMRIKSVK
ncbi:MAG: hypothetical protein K0R65_560 [Crocinitomicaceae bacterium]|jgi:hypothetical protein|nr:hypothetical protein [Crocinitomicaceae bacterium]